MIISFYKAGTATSGNRGHAGLPGRRGGSAPSRNVVNAGKLTIKANSKLASKLDSALRSKGADYDNIQNIMYRSGLTPESITSILSEQQGFNGASQLTTDKNKVGTMVEQHRVVSKRELLDLREKRRDELENEVEVIEQAHLANNPDLSNLKNKEWKEKKIELLLINSSIEAYAVMNGYDAIDTLGRITPLNNTKTLEFDHKGYLASEKAKNDQTQNDVLARNFSTYLNNGKLDMDKILENHGAELYISGGSDTDRATKETIDILLRQSGFGYQPVMEHSNNFIESMTDNEQLIFRGVKSVDISIEKMHNDFENEQVTTDSWRPSGVVGKGYYASRLERATEYADGKKSYNGLYITTDSSRRLNTRDDYNHGKANVDGFASNDAPEQRIHAFKIDKSKMMNVNTFAKMQLDYLASLGETIAKSKVGSREERKAKLLFNIAREESNFAMMMGIDGVYMPEDMSYEPPHFAIYNRTAIKTTRLNYLMDYHSVNDLNDLSKFDFGDGSWN